MFEDYPVKVPQIERIIDDIEETLNTLLFDFNGATWTKAFPEAYEVDIVLNAMRSDLRQRQTRIRGTDNF